MDLGGDILKQMVTNGFDLCLKGMAAPACFMTNAFVLTVLQIPNSIFLTFVIVFMNCQTPL